MNVNIYYTKVYKNETASGSGKNKPNSNPIKPNLRKAQMNVNLYVIEDYRKNDDFVVRINKPNFLNGQNERKLNFNKGLQKNRCFRSPKNKPNSNPISSKAKMNKKSLAGKSGHTQKNLDSGLSLIFLLTIFNMPSKRQIFGFPHLYLRLPVQESTGAGKAGSL